MNHQPTMLTLALALGVALVLLFNLAIDREATQQMASRRWRWVQFCRFSRKSWMAASTGLAIWVAVAVPHMTTQTCAFVGLAELCGLTLAAMAQHKALEVRDFARVWLKGALPTLAGIFGLVVLVTQPLDAGTLLEAFALILSAWTAYSIGEQRDLQGQLRWRD